MHFTSTLLSTLLLSAAVTAHPTHHWRWPPHHPNNSSRHHHSGKLVPTGSSAAISGIATQTIFHPNSESSLGSSVLSASLTAVSTLAAEKTSKISSTTSSTLTSASYVSSSLTVSVADVAAPSKTLCGTANAQDARASPSGAPWTYASDNYNYDAMAGAGDYCVGFYDASEDSSGTWNIHWSSIWNIDKAKCPTPEITKGYSNLAVGKNLKKQVSAVQSLNTVWNWTATNTDGIKGCITFDFMMGPTSGDYTSSSVKELMLWLWWTGGDLPIGYSDGPVATISLFGKEGWKLYQGMNTESNQLVSSLLAPVDDMYTGNFEGDLKDWFTALSDVGQHQVYPSTYFVNVGNMGTEAWYGDVTFDFHVSGFELTVS